VKGESKLSLQFDWLQPRASQKPMNRIFKKVCTLQKRSKESATKQTSEQKREKGE
jgi:hypothetical protein